MENNTTYKERCEKQLDEWVKGNPIHNKVDDECCPDFSCCRPHLLIPEERRKAFKAADDRQRESMLVSAIGKLTGGTSVYPVIFTPFKDGKGVN